MDTEVDRRVGGDQRCLVFAVPYDLSCDYHHDRGRKCGEDSQGVESECRGSVTGRVSNVRLDVGVL